MDHLQKATERARREREGAIGKTPEPGVATVDVQSAPLADTATPAPAGTAPAAAVPPPEAPTAPPKSPKQAARHSHLPTAARVRFTRTRQVEPENRKLLYNRVIAGEGDDPRVEIYRQLRAQVLGAMQRNGWKTLAITSAHENAGKTLTAVNLAIAMSKEVNQTVMLVDLDLRKPNVHTTLGVEIDAGIVDHLAQGTPLENILINPGFPRLVVLPGLPQGRHVSEILTSPEMKTFLGDITSRYPDRIIIFDLPPLLRNDDAMVFVPVADCCLMVVEDGVTTPDQLERCRGLLKNARLLGTVLNKARHAPLGH